MSDALEKLQHELKAAQRALAEAETRYARHEGERQAVAKETENTRKQIEQAHHEWISAVDAVEEPIFLHDRDFRVLRCNRAYQHCAGIPYDQIIGQPYYEVFPKTHAPLPNCRRTLENESEKADKEVPVDGKTYRSHATIIKNEQGGYLYSMHTLEDITERKRVEADLAAQLEELRRWYVVTLGREERVLELKHEVNALLGEVGQPPRYPSAESPEPKEQ
jgi:PAS domain S-box-containing protein